MRRLVHACIPEMLAAQTHAACWIPVFCLKVGLVMHSQKAYALTNHIMKWIEKEGKGKLKSYPLHDTLQVSHVEVHRWATMIASTLSLEVLPNAQHIQCVLCVYG